jgi:hypothetical protein
MLTRKLLIYSIFLSLVGCTTTQRAYIPTPVIVPKPKLHPLPDLPILASEATPAQYVEWCTKTNRMLWIELTACRRYFDE